MLDPGIRCVPVVNDRDERVRIITHIKPGDVVYESAGAQLWKLLPEIPGH